MSEALDVLANGILSSVWCCMLICLICSKQT